ncbi:unnamed protein product [Acanthoscelides obtectus]|uniref:mRNA export factor GLE1 n=1 Tax=Acanthoscelides obtectus TaxID=200917 RepID=A0A9P0KPS8_ACAOB|nr:unnamed protein product [Acanthoscelides obtectus]CAK1657331.1 Nucleoporin GLE1 [Acanthoscelides obtectus]
MGRKHKRHDIKDEEFESPKKSVRKNTQTDIVSPKSVELKSTYNVLKSRNIQNELQRHKKLRAAIQARVSKVEESARKQTEANRNEWLKEQEKFIKDLEEKEGSILQAKQEQERKALEEQAKQEELQQIVAERRRQQQEELLAKQKETKLVHSYIEKIQKYQQEFGQLYQQIVPLVPALRGRINQEDIKQYFSSLNSQREHLEEITNKCKIGQVTEGDVKKCSEIIAQTTNLRTTIKDVVGSITQKKQDHVTPATTTAARPTAPPPTEARPAIQKPTPVFPQPKPAISKPTPVFPQAVPSVSQPTSTASQPTSTVSQSTPAFDLSKLTAGLSSHPTSTVSQSALPQPKLAVSQPPAFPQLKPGVSQVTSTVSQPTPLQKPIPTFSQPSALSQPASTVSQPTPVVSQSRHLFPQPTPLQKSTLAFPQPTPAVSQQTPAASQPTSTSSQSAFDLSQLTFDISQPTPAASQTPTVSQATPALSQPKPTLAQPKFGLSQPKLALSQPTPAVSQSTFSFAQPPSTVSQPTPTFSQAKPAFSQPIPPSSQPKPVPTTSAAPSQPQVEAVKPTHKLDKYVSLSTLKMYAEIMEFYEKQTASFKELEADPALKQFRFDCKKAVNIPVNSLSGINAEHILDKYNKLYRLLSGQDVMVSDKNVNASRHPQGIAFCMNLLAKKFVLQGDLMVAGNPESAFYYATVILSLWNDFPNFGKLILAHFYKICPYLVPYYIPREQGETDEEYYVKQGYQYSDGQIEKQDKYLRRMTGLMRLYATLLISKPKRGQAKSPYSLKEGWRYIACLLNLEPQMDITATMMHTFLETVGFRMEDVYGKIFQKLIRQVTVEKFLPNLKDAKCTGGAVTRLELLLTEYTDKGRFEEPAGYEDQCSW